MTDLSALLRVVMFEQRIDRLPSTDPPGRPTPERDRLAYAMRYPPPGYQQPSYPEIRDAMGYRSHASAMDAVRRHTARLKAAGAADWPEVEAVSIQGAPNAPDGRIGDLGA